MLSLLCVAFVCLGRGGAGGNKMKVTLGEQAGHSSFTFLLYSRAYTLTC